MVINIDNGMMLISNNPPIIDGLSHQSTVTFGMVHYRGDGIFYHSRCYYEGNGDIMIVIELAQLELV